MCDQKMESTAFNPLSAFVCLNFRSAIMHSKVVKMLSVCRTAWIQMRRRVTRRLIRI